MQRPLTTTELATLMRRAEARPQPDEPSEPCATRPGFDENSFAEVYLQKARNDYLKSSESSDGASAKDLQEPALGWFLSKPSRVAIDTYSDSLFKRSAVLPALERYYEDLDARQDSQSQGPKK